MSKFITPEMQEIESLERSNELVMDQFMIISKENRRLEKENEYLQKDNESYGKLYDLLDIKDILKVGDKT